MSPTPMAPPAVATLTPPPAVKPAVVMVKPRINQAGRNPAQAGDVGPTQDPVFGGGATSGGKTSSIPRLGPVAATTRETSDTGRTKLFDNNGYFQDVASGLGPLPQNAGALSAFAYGFAGAVSGGAARKKSEAATAAATKQQEFENNLKTSAEGRANKADTRAQTELDLKTKMVDANGNLTPTGLAAVDKAAGEYAVELGLHTSQLSPEDRTKANDLVKEYRQNYINDLKNGAGIPDKLGTGNTDVSPRLRKPADRGPLGTVQDVVGGVADSVYKAGQEAGKAIFGPGEGGQAPPQATPTPAGTPQEPLKTPVTKTQGSGTADDPYRGNFAPGDQSALQAIQRMPVGSYFVIMDPTTGQESVRRRK